MLNNVIAVDLYASFALGTLVERLSELYPALHCQNFGYVHIRTATFNCPIFGVNFRLLEVAGSNHLDLRPLRFEDRHHPIWQSHYI